MCFLLNGIEKPSFYIVPSINVAQSIKMEHENWRKTPGKDGGIHQDTNMRMFYDYEDTYLNKWELLNL